jgi:RNA polymerase sigma factor (sigma-70 family)
MTVTDTDIEALIPMVEALVSTKYRRLHPERDDLIQAGMEGVCKAAKRWDATRGSAFRTYAYMRALGEIRDYLRSRQAGSRRNPQEAPVSAESVDDLACEDSYDGLVWADLERSVGHLATRILRLYTGGVLMREIAEGEGVSEGCISLRITKVRPAVRAWAA